MILGGTGFLGPKTVEAALARGHEVTIFNRGKREKVLPLGFDVEHLYGNRDPQLPADDERDADGKLLHPTSSPKGLEQLVGRRWDVVSAPVGAFGGFHRWNNDRAEATGLTFRPIGDTVKALLAWYPHEIERRVRVTRELQEAAKANGAPPRDAQDPAALRAGPKRDVEELLLAKWRSH